MKGEGGGGGGGFEEILLFGMVGGGGGWGVEAHFWQFNFVKLKTCFNIFRESGPVTHAP